MTATEGAGACGCVGEAAIRRDERAKTLAEVRREVKELFLTHPVSGESPIIAGHNAALLDVMSLLARHIRQTTQPGPAA